MISQLLCLKMQSRLELRRSLCFGRCTTHHKFVKGCRDALAILARSIRLARATHDEVQPVRTLGCGPTSIHRCSNLHKLVTGDALVSANGVVLGWATNR